ncbi:MAG: hypothetical protein WA306_09360 [Candidatus Acidiferrales bacterium]
MDFIECLKQEGLLKDGDREPRYRTISEGLWTIEDEEFMKTLPKPTGKFISYHQLLQGHSKCK